MVRKIAFGDTWVVAAIVVRLPFCSSPAALPAGVAAAVRQGHGLPGCPGRADAGEAGGGVPWPVVHGAGDAAFCGVPLAVRGATWTARLPASAVLHSLRPPPAGKRGRPAEKGKRPGTCQDITGSATWQSVTVNACGQAAAVQAAAADALRHGSFKGAAVQVVLVKDPRSVNPYDLGLLTLDTAAGTAAAVERHSWRSATGPPNATGKQIMGAKDACSRPGKAVEPTVPSGFLIQSLLVLRYARPGYDPGDTGLRRLMCPQYQSRAEPSPADMLAKLRRECLKARLSAISPVHSDLGHIGDYACTCDITAA